MATRGRSGPMTVREFKLPDLGEGLTEAEIGRWLVAVGDVVDVDQPVVEVVTAKASVELPSPYGGTVMALHHAEGEVADVGSSLLSIDDVSAASPGREDGAGTPEAGTPEAGTPETSTPEVAAALLEDAPASSAESASETSSGSVLVGYGTKPERRRRRHGDQADSGSVAAELAGEVDRANAGGGSPGPEVERLRPAVLSPVVRRLARELGVDLASLQGSGPEGVIVRADVERGGDERGGDERGDPPTQAAGEPARPEPDQRIPIRGVHRQMAERLSRSRREIPEATVWVDVDATGLLQARSAIGAAHPERPAGVGLTTLLARFCVLGLGRFPLLNSRIEGDEIVVRRGVNLGFAAQTERGLVVPVVRDAQQLTLLELDTEIRRLATAAREGTLTSAEVTGGSFTVNNYGVFGVDGSAAIINFPEVAIVGIGRIMQRPWVVEGAVTARPVTELTLAFDHRVCDGAVAGGFLRFVADSVEQPVRLLAES
jgi:2-oxoisovalerate dehydrogenase E2 component (dihydrolipoyl transacylase)